MKCKRTCGLCVHCDLTECYTSYPAQYKCMKTGYLHTFDHLCDLDELKDIDIQIGEQTIEERMTELNERIDILEKKVKILTSMIDDGK